MYPVTVDLMKLKRVHCSLFFPYFSDARSDLFNDFGISGHL